MDIPVKKKRSGSKSDVARGYMYGYTKQIPRSHSGNGTRKPQKNPSGVCIKSENNTVMVVDGGSGKKRMRRLCNACAVRFAEQPSRLCTECKEEKKQQQ